MAERKNRNIDAGLGAPIRIVNEGRESSSVDGSESGDQPGDRQPEDRATKPEDTIAGFPVISDFDLSPGSGSGASSGDTEPRRRGRPRGSGRKPAIGTAQKASNLIADLEALLLSVHFMGAKLLSMPEWELEPSEAKKLSDAIKDVAQYYDFLMDPKKLAIAQLCFCAGGIYGPRVIVSFKNAVKPKLGPQRMVPIDRQEPKTPAQEVPSQGKESEQQVTTPSQLWPAGVDDSDGGY